MANDSPPPDDLQRRSATIAAADYYDDPAAVVALLPALSLEARRTANRALDALAREPDLVARVALVEAANRDGAAALAAAEGVVARVRALSEEFHDLAIKPHEPGTTDTRLLCEGFAQRIDAALAGPGEG